MNEPSTTLENEIEYLRGKNRRLQVINNALHVTVRTIGWVNGGDCWFCPWCRNSVDQGHADDCMKEAALRLMEDNLG